MENDCHNINEPQNSSNPSNPRDNTSSDNLLSDISKAFENLKQENQKKQQNRLSKNGQSRIKNNPLPKPHIPSMILSKKQNNVNRSSHGIDDSR